MGVALLLSCFLPSVETSVYFHKDQEMSEKEQAPKIAKEKRGFEKILSDLRSAYSQPYVVKWSVWVALSTSIYYQVGNYIQPLWETILVRFTFQLNISCLQYLALKAFSK